MEKAYVRWVTRFVRFPDTTPPRHLDEDDIRAFLGHLASERNVAASTQNQSLNALIFLYEQGLGEELGTIQKLLGHRELRTTMQYVHVLEQSGKEVTNPLDTLPDNSA